jgi:hypothetical protein
VSTAFTTLSILPKSGKIEQNLSIYDLQHGSCLCQAMASIPDAKMFFFFLLSKHDADGPVQLTSTKKSCKRRNDKDCQMYFSNQLENKPMIQKIIALTDCAIEGHKRLDLDNRLD